MVRSADTIVILQCIKQLHSEMQDIRSGIEKIKEQMDVVECIANLVEVSDDDETSDSGSSSPGSAHSAP